jgi:hypothetical protein
MRTLFTIAVFSGLIVTSGCGLLHSSDQSGNGKVRILEPPGDSSSPIIVGDGSIHIRQHDYAVHLADLEHAGISLLSHQAVDVAFVRCNAGHGQDGTDASQCTKPTPKNSVTLLGKSWNLQVTDSNNSHLVNLSNPDPNFPGFILVSVGDANSSVMGTEPEDNGDGVGLQVKCKQGATNCAGNLASAVVTANGVSSTLQCPNPDGNKICTIRLRYCTVDTAGNPDPKCK